MAATFSHANISIEDMCDTRLVWFCSYAGFPFIPSPAFLLSAYRFTVLPYEMRCNSGQRFNLLLNLIKICLEFGVYLFCYVLFCQSIWNWMALDALFPSLIHTLYVLLSQILYSAFVRSKWNLFSTVSLFSFWPVLHHFRIRSRVHNV